MEPLETFFRINNAKFYLNLETCSTVRNAVKNSGITSQHGTRLLRVWKDNKWVYSVKLKEGTKYKYTIEGLKIKNALQGVIYV